MIVFGWTQNIMESQCQMLPRILNQKNNSDERNKYIVKCPFPDATIPDKTYGQLIWEKHSKWRECTAVVDGETGESYTYEQLLVKSQNIGRFLTNEGLKDNDILAICLPNSPVYIALILAACEIGLTITCINPLYTADEIAIQMKDSRAIYIVTFGHKLPVVKRVVEELSEVSQKKIRIILINEREDRPVSVGVTYLNEILSNSSVMNNPAKYCEDNLDKKLAYISYSSGTTSLPKGVCLSYRNITASMMQLSIKQRTVLRETNDTFQDVIPCVLPIFHIFGLSIVLNGLYFGSKIITLSKFQETTFLKTLNDHKVSFLITVPPMLQFLGKRETVTEEHLRHLRCLIVGGAPTAEEDIRNCMKKAPLTLNFVQMYGQTEATGCLTHTPYGSKNSISVGQPVPNTELIVVDVESDKRLPANQNGEICFRGPQMTSGYLNNPKATSETIDSDGWFHTGDVGYYDEEGYIYIVDRIKDLIKVKGFQVAPAELEAVLLSHPHVEEAGVISVPHKKKGESPIGFIKLKAGASITADDLKDYFYKKVAPYKVIDNYYFVDSMPKTSSGKILRRKLKEMYVNIV